MPQTPWLHNIFRSKAEQALSFRLLALPLSWLFRLIILIRQKSYAWGLLPRHRLPGRCISVGNITLGGTGKSPVVIALALHLRREGHTPAVISRGYGSTLGAHDFACISGGKILATTSSKDLRYADEAMMQSHYLGDTPIILGRNRYRAAQWYLRRVAGDSAPSHWLLDDGYQHISLQRDLDLLLLDFHQPFANAQLLPLGPLRESPPSLARADALLLTRALAPTLPALVSARLREFTSAPCLAVPFHTLRPRRINTGTGEELPPALADKKLLAVVGIAQPAGFFAALAAQQIHPADQVVVPDHQALPPQLLAARSASHAGIVTTAKDYYRDPPAFLQCNKPVYVMELVAALPYAALKAHFPRIFS